MDHGSPAEIRAGLGEPAVAVAPDAAALLVSEHVEVAIRWLGSAGDRLLVLDNLTTPADAEAVRTRVPTWYQPAS
ncbi:hypothetical protein Q5425_27465 [Amycolatopsis sp. A133]|uniref:hypothetical protein n=1 Tax=Amycolatopsis sp. A133 TaxID=3064472 RepID=UPI0027FFA833|nr:hypothetical protein [Amycolatopsis sp. A133]MDQ7807492.1 hypothetical protein [Amycolatopsis sp. A133]